MKIYEVTDRLLQAIESDKYQFIRVNFANGDMVGHTGNINSCIKAVKAVDECVKKVVDKTLAKKGMLLITADHGNVEEKLDKKGKMVTSHTLNPVPCFIIDSQESDFCIDVTKIKEPGIANITATFINLLGFKAPDLYEKSLISLE